MPIKYLAIRVSVNTKIPTPNFYRNITHINLATGNIEVYAKEYFYWLDNFIFSSKQLKWLGDIKSKILRLIPEAMFVDYSTDSRYIDLSNKIFTLKTLQQVWTRKLTDRKFKLIAKTSGADSLEDTEDISLMPSLIPMATSGKTEANLYKVLTQYATRLHYEKLFQFEYLSVASKIYNENIEEKILPRKLLKLTHKAFDFITEEIKSNPHYFKQKLDPKELRRVRINHGLTVLQKSNKRKRNDNTEKVKAAIATSRHYKANGTTLNISSLAKATSLSRQTVTTILKTL